LTGCRHIWHGRVVRIIKRVKGEKALKENTTSGRCLRMLW
jgi:hypothetical protein